jgi:LPS sulfotransferase NodH
VYTHHKVDHEYPAGLATRLSYMECSVPRSGRSLLCERLCNTEAAGAPTEFFDPELMARFRERWGVSTFEDYVARLLERKTSPNGVFGIKVHWRQLHPALGDTDPGGIFPALRYLHIRRDDLLRQAISWVRALQTNQWASSHRRLDEPVFDRRLIDTYLGRIREEDGEWERWFTRRGIAPHRVVYERLVEAPDETVQAALGFLDIEGDGEVAPLTLEQQADELTDDWVARYAAKS